MTSDRVVRLVAAAAVAAVFVLGIASLYRSRHRGLDLDEAEYLQTGWLMKCGKQLYVDFVEDHAPYLFMMFEPVLPHAGVLTTSEARQYATQARLLCGAAGVLAVACAGLLAFRISGTMVAPLIVGATLFGSFTTWNHAIADARNDPPALLLFWLGALLIVAFQKRSIAWASCGIGLVAIAALWNPKWPLESVVLGVVFLISAWRSRAWTRALLPAGLLIAVAVIILVSVTSLRDYLFFVFPYNGAMMDYPSAARPLIARNFAWCGAPFRAPYHFAAFAALPICLLRLKNIDRRALFIVGLIAIAALIEIWFVYPYPVLSIQYYLLWSFALAILYGAMAGALLTLLRSPIVTLAAVLTTLILFTAWNSLRMDAHLGDDFWQNDQMLRRRLQPGDTTWIDTPSRLLIGTPIATYYWFSFSYLVPFSLRYQQQHPESPLPHLTEDDLPICRAATGKAPELRLITADFKHLQRLEKTCGCLRLLIAQGRARPAGRYDIYEISR